MTTLELLQFLVNHLRYYTANIVEHENGKKPEFYYDASKNKIIIKETKTQ